MKYYTSKSSNDIYIAASKYTIVPRALLTENECRKLHIPTKILAPVEVSKRKVYWMFGYRFNGNV